MLWSAGKLSVASPMCKIENTWNKKVLPRERKRHTACRCVSTASVVLTGYPPLFWPGRGGSLLGGTLPGGYLPGYPLAVYPPSWPGGYPNRVPPCPGWGVPYLGTPWQCTPHPGLGGYPARMYPNRVPPCPGWGVPYLGTPPAGYPPSWPGRVPPPSWTGWVPPRCLPMEFWVMLQSIMGYGYPPVSAPWHSG